MQMLRIPKHAYVRHLAGGAVEFVHRKHQAMIRDELHAHMWLSEAVQVGRHAC
jgi:hypothetical protein